MGVRHCRAEASADAFLVPALASLFEGGLDWQTGDGFAKSAVAVHVRLLTSLPR